MNRKRPLNEKEIWEQDSLELDLSSDESDDEVKDPEFQLTPFQRQLLGEDGEDRESVDDPDSPDEEEIIEQPEDEDESIQRPPAKKCKKTAKTLPKWTSKRFQGRPIQTPRQQIPPPAVKKFEDYFRDYFDEDFFEDAANMYSAKVSGKSFNTDRHELRRFVRCCYIIGVIKYPRLKMYWQREFAFPSIAETMSRDRFLTLRVIFHLVDTSLPPPDDDVNRNRLWKVQPIIDAVRSACGRISRVEVTYSVDEQMIPFDGRCSMKQYVKKKPRPRGLKNVVITSSTGQVCDFEIFQGGSTDLPDRELGLGLAFVLRLTRTLPEKSFLYFDRYFTTIPLLETLKEKKMEGTGTIMANRVKGINLAKQNDVQRGQSKEYVSGNGQIVVVAWKDKNKVILASTCHGIHPNEAVQRWSKQERKYVEISCPAIARNYNHNQYMGGVDVCDQQMEYYRSFFKTTKWTWKVIMHFYDLAVVNIWFKYRKDSQANNAKFVDLMTLKLALADVLTHSAPSNPQTVSSSEGEHSEPEETPRRRSKFANHAAKLPTMEKRRDGYRHTPVVDDLKTARTCRSETCKSRTGTRCAKCNVYLYLAKNQNCFQEFHA